METMKKEELEEQYAKIYGEASEEDKNKFAAYPGIEIKKHINHPGMSYTIVFFHPERLSTKDLNLSGKWIFGVNHKVYLNMPILFSTNKND
jgi:hypothetical protein